MENLQDVIKERDLLLKEIVKLKGNANKPISTKGEWLWIQITKFIGLIIMLLPFIPNAFYYIGVKEELLPSEYTDYFYVFAGALMFFAQGKIGELLNAWGKKLIGKN